ncbi:MAG: acyl-CoA dehydrogenase family protein, partial [Rhodobacteraceae bacterium]|nr:acyl-CoA dehydrogenase family protein [Paracoccaceae bacterium]
MIQAERAAIPEGPLLPGLLDTTRQACEHGRALLGLARSRLRARLGGGGRVSGAALEAHQSAAHALAWLATCAEGLVQLQGWAERLAAEDRLGEMEQLILQIGFGEYLAQIAGGIPMSQGEIARPADIGLEPDDLMPPPVVSRLMRAGNSDGARARLVELMEAREGASSFGATGLGDEDEMIRDMFRRFAEEKVVPHAHGWHLRDELIPIEIVAEMCELGVFGLTIPEEY